MSLTSDEKQTAMRLWNQGGYSASKIAAMLDAERGNRGEVTKGMVVGTIHRARVKDSSIRKSDQNEAGMVERAKARRKRISKPGLTQPPRVHDKPAKPVKHKEVEGEFLGDGAAFVDSTHLYRAAGQRDVPFMERRFGECAWPAWPNEVKVGPVCGLPVKGDGFSYCTFHHGIGTSGSYGSQPYRIR